MLAFDIILPQQIHVDNYQNYVKISHKDKKYMKLEYVIRLILCIIRLELGFAVPSRPSRISWSTSW